MFNNFKIADKLLYGSRNRDVLVAADNIVKKNEFLLPPYGRVVIDVKNNFKCKENSRSLWRLIHGLTFLGDLYSAYSKTNNVEYLYKGREIIHFWIIYRKNNPDDTMVLHDETTALRLSYLLKFLHFSERYLDEKFNNELKNEIDITVQLLLQDNFHSTNTNHGMFQDMALLAYSILKYKFPKDSDIYKVAVKRLLQYFLNCFTSDGVHKEHSPDYHYMVTHNVHKVTEVISELGDSLTRDEEKLLDIFKNAESYAMHILLPNLNFPRISDCSGINLKGHTTYYNMFDSDEFKFVKTEGEEGKEPLDIQKAFLDAGYFVSRSGWKKEDSYFLFLASYNAGYHKHTDDLSFIIYDNKDELFIDSGPNGYDYKDKFTKYAYSGFAHSTLIVNNTSLPRNDKQFNKVGLNYAKYESDGYIFDVEGFNNRYESVNHTRRIQGNNKIKEYIITDEIISSKRNEYKLLFQISGKLNTIINSNIISIYKKTEKIAEIEIIDDSLNSEILISNKREQLTPLVQGFEFVNMGNEVPSNTIELKFFNETEISKVRSIIRLANFKTNLDIIKNEKSFGQHHIKYTIYEPETKVNRLFVVFSAMMPSYLYKYNYYTTLKDIESYQLYIKDDSGEYGNYYLGKRKNLAMESNVISLIQNIIRQYNIDFENVTLIGSSKGATAALYYGLKYGFKNVIAGAPQTKIGNFVIDEAPHKDVANIISGGNEIGDKLYLNSIFNNLDILPGNYENFYICVGTNNHHLKGHIMPFLNEFSSKGIDFNIIKIPEADHTDLKYYFKQFLYESINTIYDLKISYNEDYLTSLYDIDVKNIKTFRENGKLSIDLDIVGYEYVIIYYMLDKQKNITSRSKPQTSNIITLKEEAFLNKRIKIFIRGKYQTKSFISTIIRDINDISISEIK